MFDVVLNMFLSMRCTYLFFLILLHSLDIESQECQSSDKDIVFNQIKLEEYIKNNVKNELKSDLKNRDNIIRRLTGQNVTISCSSTLSKNELEAVKLNVTWYLYEENTDKFSKLENQEYNLTLRNITNEDEGVYSCVFDNMVPRFTGNNIVILQVSNNTVDLENRITSQHIVKTAYIGETLRMCCAFLENVFSDNASEGYEKVKWFKVEQSGETNSTNGTITEKESVVDDPLAKILIYKFNDYDGQNKYVHIDLEIHNVDKSRSGKYQCRAEIRSKEYLTRTFWLDVKDYEIAPYGHNFRNFTAEMHNSVTFEFAIDYHTYNKLVWAKLNNILSSTIPIREDLEVQTIYTDNVVSYTLPNVNYNHQGWYSCNIHLNDDSVYRITLYLFVNNNTTVKNDDETCINNDEVSVEEVNEFQKIPAGPPIFAHSTSLQEKHVLLKRRDNFRLSCDAYGNPMPNYTWFLDDNEINNFGTFGYKKMSLHIKSFGETDEGKYVCKVCNNLNDCVNRTTILSMDHSEKLNGPNVTQMENLTAEVKSSITLYCGIIFNQNAFVQWNKMNILEHRYGNSVTHKINNVSREHEGWYHCTAVAEEGMDFKSMYLNIVDEHYFKKPTVDLQTDYLEFKGAPVNLHCGIKTNSYTFVFWIKLEKNAKTGNLEQKKRYLQLDRLEADGSSTYSIMNANSSHEGYYSCLAINKKGWENATSKLTIQKPGELATQKPDDTVKIVLEIAMILLIFLGITVVFFIIKRYKKQNDAISQWVKTIIVEKVENSLYQGEEGLQNFPVVKIERKNVRSRGTNISLLPEFELPLDPFWEFPRENLQLEECLGAGEFGKVVKAIAYGITEPNRMTTVAVKMLKDGYSDTDMIDFVAEMEIMKLVGKHKNIVNILGCCTRDGVLLIITEFASNGNLREFLRQTHAFQEYEVPKHLKQVFSADSALSEKTLISFAYQVAKGMEYLISKKCVHRDLAARNILVCDNFVLKIADFGLARNIRDYYYRKETDGKIPIRWLAPESFLRNMYTAQTDVWSYGIVLWEIMSIGETPYALIPIDNLFELIIKGYRMKKPTDCSDDIYNVMNDCWKYNPNERPSFSHLVKIFEKMMIVKAPEYLNLDACGQNDISSSCI